MTFTPEEHDLYKALEDKNNEWVKKIDPMNFSKKKISWLDKLWRLFKWN